MMKLTTELKELQRAVKAIGQATTAKTTLPILGMILFTAKGDKLSVSGTNLDIYVRVTIAAKITEEGEATVSYKMLHALVSRLTSKTVKLTEKKNAVEIACGETTALIESLPAEEFPPALPMDEKESITCTEADFLGPLRQTVYAVSDDISRYVMQGVAMQPNEKGTDFIATNGRQMALSSTEAPLGNLEIIMPEQFVNAVLSNLAGAKEITLYINANGITAETENGMVQGKLIEGNFPNWKQVIPKPSKLFYSCNRAELIEAVHTAAIFGESVTITGEKKTLKVSNREHITTTVLGTELKGQPTVTYCLNPGFLLSALKVISCQDVKIEVTDELTPIVIKDGSFRGVIQGMRQSS